MMNKEIEAKYNISDVTIIEKLINKLGFEKKGTSNTKDIYFCVPEKKPHTRYLRIRINGEQGELAYHEVINNEQTNEWEVIVENHHMLNDIVQKLGFKQDVIVQKKRVKYILEPVVVVLDRVRSLGDYIEIEAPDVKTLNLYIKKFKLDDKNRVVGLGYPDLLREKINETATK